MSIKNSKSNICSLEDEKETSKQDGDMESPVSKTLTARTAQFISKININIEPNSNKKKMFSIEQDLKVSFEILVCFNLNIFVFRYQNLLWNLQLNSN